MLRPNPTLLYIVVFLCSSFFLTAQDIRINEAVSSNSEYFDEDGDTPDWLEIHNYGTTPVSLLDWGLTDDEEELDQWKFPDINLQPDEYLLIWASKKDRSEISYARTLVNQGDIHRYLIPTSEPTPTWKNINFDATSWMQGASGFGYGDGDDATVIATGTASIFTRTSFTITNLNDISSLILDVDYDDGFVAYINGVEVVRANINGTPPPYDSGTVIGHEAEIYNGGTPDRFIIDNPSSVLVEGENVLAIQAHNTSSTSSDLTIIPFLTALYGSPSSVGVNPPTILGLSDNNLHTNFKISSKSETLILSDASGIIISEMLVEGLQSNISLGTSTTTGNLVFFLDTTPGAVNSSTEYLGVLQSDIEFSHQGGLVSEASINLVLSGNTGTQVIRYTLDATEPTEVSPEYNSGIAISNNTVVRARLFDAGSIPSYSASKSYIFNANHEIDVVFLTTDPDNLFDEDSGIYAYGDSYDTESPHHGANFWEDWERPVHFSFLNKDTQKIEVEFNAGIKIFGGYSRANDQRSLSIFARGQYGTSEMEYPFFNTVGYDEFQALVLRNSGNDWLASSIKDATLTSLMEGSGLDFQAFNPVATYINDAYWGMYNLREKTNEHMLASKHDVDADDINLLGQNAEIIKGTNEGYLELIHYVTTTNLASDNNFEFVANRVDLENYALYQATQIFFNNTDWPGNNIKFWNHPDGKWRWILYDTDFGFGPPWNTANYNENTLSFALETNGPSWPNPSWSTLLFRKMVKNISFRNRFVNRYADELNTRFVPEKVKNHIEDVFLMVAPEINAHYTRWGGNPSDATSFKNQIKTFAENRPSIVKEHIKSEFSLPDYHALTITNTDVSQGYVEVNDNLIIQEISWSGDYFETVPVKLTAIPEPGYVFSFWSGASNATSAEIEIDLQNAAEIIPHFVDVASLDALIINEINYKSSDEFDPDDWVELYNPNAVNLDVSNWILKDDDDEHAFIFPVGTEIKAKGFLIVAKDVEDFSAVFPTIENVLGDIGFGFGGSDAVRLYNSSEELQDEVVYSSDTWADCANGLGPTLELISPDLENSLPESWDCTNTNGTPNMHNDDSLIDDGIYLVINEINYKSSDDFNAGDWIELYNPNADAVDLSNWVLKDDKDDNVFAFPEGTSVASQGYLVVVKEAAAFMAAYPTINNIVGDFDFGLGSGSDAVRLFDASGFLKDEVSYTSENPWPSCANGLGPTMELISPNLDNSLPESWECTNTIGTPNLANNEEFSLEEEEFEPEEVSEIILFPVPTENILHINATGNFQINIFDITGQKVYAASDSIEMDISLLASGIYMVEYVSGDKKVYQKIIINSL